MQRVLGKRVIRDLKQNLFRYLALGLMITMGIFLVVSIVGDAETMTSGTLALASETRLEDGEFKVFMPLSDADTEEISELGFETEELFYFDHQMDDEDKSTLRIFKIRKNINRVHYISGAEPVDDNEAVLEKRYAEEHGLTVGDSIEIAGKTYRISGIGVVSDYDGPQKEYSDTSCNSRTFGLVFMTDAAYEAYKTSGKAQKAEEYLYAYRSTESKPDKELKDFLKDLKIT
nr:ABC transporter permease [Lachnospiraceae bacterium]